MYDWPDRYTRGTYRNVTKNDTQVTGPSGEYTIRRWYSEGKFIRADVYLVGRWMGGYKTEAGISRRVSR